MLLRKVKKKCLQLSFRGEFRRPPSMPSSYFEVSVGGPRFPFRMRSTKRGVRIGYHTTLTVRPTVLRAGEGLRELDPEVRECLFEDERKLEVMNEYSKILVLFC